MLGSMCPGCKRWFLGQCKGMKIGAGDLEFYRPGVYFWKLYPADSGAKVLGKMNLSVAKGQANFGCPLLDDRQLR